MPLCGTEKSYKQWFYDTLDPVTKSNNTFITTLRQMLDVSTNTYFLKTFISFLRLIDISCANTVNMVLVLLCLTFQLNV